MLRHRRGRKKDAKNFKGWRRGEGKRDGKGKGEILEGANNKLALAGPIRKWLQREKEKPIIYTLKGRDKRRRDSFLSIAPRDRLGDKRWGRRGEEKTKT